MPRRAGPAAVELKHTQQIPLGVPQESFPERRVEDRKGTPPAATHSEDDDLVAEPGPDNWSSSMGTSFLPSVHHCWERRQGKGCRLGKYRLWTVLHQQPTPAGQRSGARLIAAHFLAEGREEAASAQEQRPGLWGWGLFPES